MESDAYGIELGPLRDRSDRLEEGMEVIVRLLTERSVTHSGRFYQLTDAWCEPKPLQERIPVVIGGQGRLRTLHTAAKYADQWDMTFPADVAAWRELDEVLRAHCERAGRDQSAIARSVHLGFETDGDLRAAVAGAQEFFDAGVDVVVWSWRGELDPAHLEALATAIGKA